MSEWIDAETRVRRAHRLYEQGRWVEAAAELSAAIDVNPINPSWHFNLGVTFEAMEDYARACEAFRKVVKIDPRDVEAMNCLGVNMTRLGQYTEALKQFERVQKVSPKYEPSYCNRIVTYTEMGDFENAELMFYLAR